MPPRNAARIVPWMFVLATTVSTVAQQTPPTDPRDRAAAQRVSELSAPLRFNGDEPDLSTRLAQLGAATNRVFREIDDYVQSGLGRSENSSSVQGHLRAILTEHRPNPEYGDLPFAQVVDLLAGHSLVASFTLVRGPHNDVGTIRGYRWEADHFELVATTGGDFEGYSMSKTALHSPLRDEFWLLVWGQQLTFNGNKTRFRLYAFDGQNFRTVWEPGEDLFDASLHVLDSGFTIDHAIPHSPTVLHDEYRLTLNGPIKTN